MIEVRIYNENQKLRDLIDSLNNIGLIEIKELVSDSKKTYTDIWLKIDPDYYDTVTNEFTRRAAIYVKR